MRISDRPALKVGVSREFPALKVGRTRTEAGVHDRWTNTEATRYLCASAYLNRAFRNWVIRHYMENKHVAVAVSYGIDPVTILKHCQIARRISTTRDLLLLIPLVMVGVGFLLTIELPFLFVISAFLALVVAFCIVVWERWTLEFKIVRGKFTKKNFDASTRNQHFDEHNLQIFREIDTAQEANVMIYAGFSPFVGCGNNIGSWSLPVDMEKGKEDAVSRLRPMAFDLKDLYNAVATTFRKLEFPNCAIEDKLCVNGLDIRGEEKFLPDLMGRPCTQIESESIEEPGAESSTQARRYQTFRLVDWSGELILSTFLRFAKTGHNLFIEVTYCLLVPIDEDYRKVDTMNPVPSFLDWTKLFVESAINTIFVWLALPFYILDFLSHPFKAWSHERELKRMIRENPAFNHGAVLSMREATCTSNLYRRYFQKLDKEMYLKTLENSILASIVEFLDSHNIDTHSLKQAQTTIVNSGIIVSGSGSLEAQTLAVGQAASAQNNEAPRQGAIKFLPKLNFGNRGEAPR